MKSCAFVLNFLKTQIVSFKKRMKETSIGTVIEILISIMLFIQKERIFPINFSHILKEEFSIFRYAGIFSILNVKIIKLNSEMHTGNKNTALHILA